MSARIELDFYPMNVQRGRGRQYSLEATSIAGRLKAYI